MKQKRKVKNLNPNAQATGKCGIKMWLILAGCIFSLCSIFLLTSTAWAAGWDNWWDNLWVSYTWFDDRIEVLYKVWMTTGNDTENDEIYLNNGVVIITPRKVIANSSDNSVNNDVYWNILWWDHNEIKSDNVTIVAWSGNIISENNENSTILWWKNNKVEGIRELGAETPSVIIWWINNLINNVQNWVVILWWNWNENSDDKSFILWWAGNKINNENVIVWWINNTIGQENIFSFSNKNTFDPTKNRTFYLYLIWWLWINTRSNKWVASKWAISFGEINIDNLECTGNIHWLQWSMSWCLVWCTGSWWDLMDFSDYCISKCNEHSSCNFQKNEKNINGAISSCADNVNTYQATLCPGNLNAYKNSIFQSKLVNYNECPSNRENKCVYQCDNWTKLLEDHTWKHDWETRCFKSCKLPPTYNENWNPEIVEHNGTAKWYTQNYAQCDSNGFGDRCENYLNTFVCNDGEWYYSSDKYGNATDKAPDFYKTCTLYGYSCEESSQEYNLTFDEIDETRWTYSKCYDYEAENNKTCKKIENNSDIHYKLNECKKWYTRVGDECKENCKTNENIEIEHGETIELYPWNNETCPNTCEKVTLTCDDWTLKNGGNSKDSNNKPYNDYLWSCTLSTPSTYSCNIEDYKISGNDLNDQHTKYEECSRYSPNTSNNKDCNTTTMYRIESCDDGFHAETWKNICIDNTTQKNCIAWTIANWSYTVEEVDVTWNTSTNDWNTTPSCTEFTCNTGYEPKDGACVQKTTSEW